jgi:hypothetical protein
MLNKKNALLRLLIYYSWINIFLLCISKIQY